MATTSVGEETAAQTVARINAARDAAKAAPVTKAAPTNALTDALTARVIEQGKGISSSSTSSLQGSIDEAIAGIQTAGDLTSERLQSERSREVGFAEDRASATYGTALEGRTGYATQTAGLRELTETTEKSIRDLDKRYSEAIMMNDAQTAGAISDMIIKKEEFQMQQEQNYYNNLFQSAGLQLQATAQQDARDQFNANYDLQKTKLNLEEDMFLQSKEKDIATLASQFGIVIGEDDTLNDIVNKVAPIQSKYLNLQQQNLISEMSARNEQSQSDKALANLEGTVAGYIADGMTPSQASMQAIADLTAIGLRPTTEDLNSAVTFAEKAQESYDTLSQQSTMDQQGYWDLVGAGIGDTWVGKTQESVGEWLSGLSLRPITEDFKRRTQ